MSAIYGYTINYKFNLINFDTSTWHTYEYDNWRVLDAILASYIGISGIKGKWLNSTAYDAGDTVVDTDDGSIWKALVNRVSDPLPSTFKEDRDTNSGWTQVGAALFNQQARRYARDSKSSMAQAMSASVISNQKANEAKDSAEEALVSETNSLLLSNQAYSNMLITQTNKKKTDNNRIQTEINRDITHNNRVAVEGTTAIIGQYDKRVRGLYNKFNEEKAVVTLLASQTQSHASYVLQICNKARQLLKQILDIRTDVTTKQQQVLQQALLINSSLADVMKRFNVIKANTKEVRDKHTDIVSMYSVINTLYSTISNSCSMIKSYYSKIKVMNNNINNQAAITQLNTNNVLSITSASFVNANQSKKYSKRAKESADTLNQAQLILQQRIFN